MDRPELIFHRANVDTEADKLSKIYSIIKENYKPYVNKDGNTHKSIGLVFCPTVQAVAQDVLAGVVHGAGGLIEEQNGRVQQQCAGHQYGLALAAGEQLAALTHRPVEALRVLPGKIADAGHFRDFEHALVADIAGA